MCLSAPVLCLAAFHPRMSRCSASIAPDDAALICSLPSHSPTPLTLAPTLCPHCSRAASPVRGRNLPAHLVISAASIQLAKLRSSLQLGSTHLISVRQEKLSRSLSYRIALIVRMQTHTLHSSYARRRELLRHAVLCWGQACVCRRCRKARASVALPLPLRQHR